MHRPASCGFVLKTELPDNHTTLLEFVHKEISFYSHATFSDFLLLSDGNTKRTSVLVIPYCAEEGFPEHEIFGVRVPLLETNHRETDQTEEK